MEELERFKKVIDYLKTKANKPTNEAVSELLRYKTLSYISDVIGGSKPITDLLLDRMVEFSINKDWVMTGKGSMLMPIKESSDKRRDPTQIILDTSTVSITLQDYINLLKEMKSKEEERGKELISIIKELAAGQKAITESLQPIKEQTAEILTNSKKATEDLLSLKTEVAAENGEIMATLDQIAGNEIGTTAARSGTVEIGHRIEKAQKGKKANTGKQS